MTLCVGAISLKSLKIDRDMSATHARDRYAYFSASGLTGEPTALVNGMGGAESRKV